MQCQMNNEQQGGTKAGGQNLAGIRRITAPVPPVEYCTQQRRCRQRSARGSAARVCRAASSSMAHAYVPGGRLRPSYLTSNRLAGLLHLQMGGCMMAAANGGAIQHRNSWPGVGALRLAPLEWDSHHRTCCPSIRFGGSPAEVSVRGSMQDGKGCNTGSQHPRAATPP